MVGMALSDPQREVLEMIASKQERLFPSELGRLLGKTQSAVFKNIQPLLEAKILIANQEYRGGPQYLTLSDKGAFTILANSKDITLDILMKNHPYLFNGSDKNERQLVQDAMSIRFANIYYRTIAELALNLNLFDPNGAFILSGKRYNSDIKQRYGHYFQTVLIEITFRLKDAARDMKKGEYIHWQEWLAILHKHEVDPNKAQMIIQ